MQKSKSAMAEAQSELTEPRRERTISRAERVMRIATFFADRRKMTSLSLDDVAHALDLSDGAVVAAYESGEKPIPLEDIFVLTNTLNIPPEDVLGMIYDISHDDFAIDPS